MLPKSKAKRLRSWTLAGAALLALAPAVAQETIGYTYDARGRLVKVDHGTTGPNANVVSSYTYDAADNRSNVTVTGAGTTTITVAPTSLPGGTVNSAYSQTISASGGTSPYTFSYTGTLPTGLSFSSSGVLSGTPTSAGTYTFTVTATDSASHSGSQAYNVTIAAAATCVGVSFATGNASANEGSNLSFTVTKSGTTSNTCTVNYATANGTAVAGTNYTATSGTLSFASGATSQVVTVATIYDYVVTGALTIKLNLSSPSGSATITTAQGAGTINNIDTAGTTTIQLTSGTSENLRTIANANGYAGSSSANYTFVVGSGVTVTGSAGSGIGIDTGSWPAGVTLALQVNGIVRGGGGNGGNGGLGTTSSGGAGGAGGDAIRCSVPITISVNSGGSVQAGGGGGGGGGGTTYSTPVGLGTIGGDGGGGGAPNGAGGTGATGSGNTGANGSPGTTSGGGVGGSTGGPTGGNGGTYATAGTAGVTPSPSAGGGAGGAAGYAVRKNGTSCTASGAGTITGTVG